MKKRIVAIIAFYNSKNELLLQERWNYSKKWEKWAFFWWWIETWETYLEWFFREAKEELWINMSEFNYKYIWEIEQYYKEEDFIAYRHIFLVKTDKEAKDFNILEWSWCKYFSFDEAKKLHFPSDPKRLIDFIKTNILVDSLVEKAIRILSYYFDDKFISKKPTLFHSIRVWTNLYQKWYNADIVLAWYLHDILEDSDIKSDFLIDNFSKNIYEIILANTKNKNIKKEEINEELIKRCADFWKEALIVKAFDIYDNFLYYKKENNLSEIQRCKTLYNLIKKYQKQEYNEEIFFLLENI